MRSLLPTLRTALRTRMPTVSRPISHGWASRAASTKASSISSILASAREETPLKDAVKFVKPGAKSRVWTFHELESHVNALARGLRGLGYSDGERILTVLEPHEPEYAVLLLAAARSHLTLIALPHSCNDVPIDMVATALDEYKPKALFVPQDASGDIAAATGSDDRIVASVNPVLAALDEDVALRDAAGLGGFVSVTGRSFRSSRFPSLRHVVHTGADNVRAAITFRSLLVYGNSDISTGSSSDGTTPPFFMEHKEAAGVTEADIVSDAKNIGSRLGLSPDHSNKTGKLVVKPDISKQAVSNAVAALMHQSLWLCVHPQSLEETAAVENATMA